MKEFFKEFFEDEVVKITAIIMIAIVICVFFMSTCTLLNGPLMK